MNWVPNGFITGMGALYRFITGMGALYSFITVMATVYGFSHWHGGHLWLFHCNSPPHIFCDQGPKFLSVPLVERTMLFIIVSTMLFIIVSTMLFSIDEATTVDGCSNRRKHFFVWINKFAILRRLTI